MNITTPNDKGLHILGGVYSRDKDRSVGMITISNPQYGRETNPAQVIVGGKDTIKYPKTHLKPNKTERKGLVTSRVGQGFYRQELIKKFDNKCAVTGINVEEILIASHIVPWRHSNDEERLDVDNGILLSPLYDSLFDKNLISFEDNGKIIISEKVQDKELISLINFNAKIKISEGMKKYLNEHRSKLR